MKRMKELEDENRRLKKMYAEEKLKAEIAREAIEKIPDTAGQAQW
jgi:putative transposase